MPDNDLDPGEFLENYSRTKLQCRVDRHRWGRKVFYDQVAPSFARRYVTCQDCATQRWIEINIKSFEWTGRSGYNYANGYLASGLGLTRADFCERQYRSDYTEAVEAGRIEYRAQAAEEPTAEVTPIKKTKKAS